MADSEEVDQDMAGDDHGGESSFSDEVEVIGDSDDTKTIVWRSGTSVKPLEGTDVRWFYKHPKPKEAFQPLRGRDSLLVEAMWRQKKNLEMPSSVTMSISGLCACGAHEVILDGLYKVDIEKQVAVPIYWEGDALLLTRGSWFTVSQGKFLPLEDAEADSIEEEHLNHFQGQNVPETSTIFDEKEKRSVIHEKKFKGFMIQWFSPIDVNLFYTATAARVFRFVGIGGKGLKLVRGYQAEAFFDDAPHPVTHLLFVVHGIGQKRQLNEIVNKAKGLQELSTDIMKSEFAEIKERPVFLPIDWRRNLTLDGGVVDTCTPANIGALRELLNSTGLDIMYYQSPFYRNEIINSLTAELNRLHEIFCRLNPSFHSNGGKISVVAHSLGSVLMYDIVTGWSPLLVFDQYLNQRIKELLGNQINDPLKTKLEEFASAKRQLGEFDGGLQKILSDHQTQLNFQISSLFNIGSPLPVFLALRGFKKGDSLLPHHCADRIFNIYHGLDPVAYRLEPLIHPGYSVVKPVHIYHHHDKNKTPYEQLDYEYYSSKEVKTRPESRSPDLRMADDLDADSGDNMAADNNEEAVLGNGVTSTDDKKPTASASAAASNSPTPGVFSRLMKGVGAISSRTVQAKSIAFTSASQTVGEISKSNGPGIGKTSAPAVEPELLIPDNEKLEHRLDFTVKYRRKLSDWLPVYAHVVYWSSTDIVCFILTHLFQDKSGVPLHSKL